MVDIDYGTVADYEELYGSAPPFSARIWSVREDGVLHSVFGYYFTAGLVVAFCEIRGTHSRRKVLVVAKRCMERLAATRLPLVALANPKLPTAGNFLTHLGFTHLLSSVEGEIYKWPHR